MKYSWNDLYTYIRTMGNKLDSNKILHPFSDNDYWTIEEIESGVDCNVSIRRLGNPVMGIFYENVTELPDGRMAGDVCVTRIDPDTGVCIDWITGKIGDKIEKTVVTSRTFGVNGKVFLGVLSDLISQRISRNEAILESIPVKQRAAYLASM